LKTNRPEIEHQLVKRLKVLGLTLLVFALIAIGFMFIPASEEVLYEEEIAHELADPPPLNPYLVSSVFGAVGLGCLFIVRKKKKRFSASTQTDDPE